MMLVASRVGDSKDSFRLKPFYYFLFSTLATSPVVSTASPVAVPSARYMAISTESPYHPRLTLNAQAGSYGYGQLDYVYPLLGRDQSLFFIDGRYQAASLGSKEYNLGLVYRRLLFCNQNLLGAYAWVDRLESSEYKYFSQATFGAEFLGNVYAFRGNLYFPYGTKSAQVSGTSSASISGNSVSVLEQGNKQQSLAGADIEAGRVIPGIPKLYAYVDYFHFGKGSDPSVHGERARIEYYYNYNVVMTASYSYDNVRQGVGFVGVRLGFGGVDQSPSTPMKNRMEDFVIRDIDIITVNQPEQPVVYTDSRKYWFVNNAAGAGGDGSVEHPFDTEAAAEAASASGDVIYTYKGNGVYALPGGGLNLQTNQLFTGSGGNLIFHNTIVLPATSAPVLNGRINVANGTTLSNFTLSGTSSGESVGIYGNGVSNVTLSNLTVQDFTGTSADGSPYSTSGGSATGGGGGVGGSVTGIQLINGTNVTLSDVTVKNIIGGSANGGDASAYDNSTSNSSTGGDGGTGGNATGIDLTNTSSTLNNVTVSGITGGSANGGDASASSDTYYTYYYNNANGGNGGTGGNAKGIDLTGATTSLSNTVVTGVSGGAANAGDAAASGSVYYYYGNSAVGGVAGTGGAATAIDLSGAIASMSHINVANILGGAALGGDASASGASSNYSYGGNGGSGGNASGVIETGATITSSNNLVFSNVTGGLATAGVGSTGSGVAGTAGTGTNIVP